MSRRHRTLDRTGAGTRKRRDRGRDHVVGNRVRRPGRAAGSRNQILITLRDLNGPVISSEELERLSSGAPIRVALPQSAAVSVRRNSAAGPVSNGTRQAVLNLLARFGVQPDFPTRVLPMYAVSPSDSALEPLVAALLKSPHVEYLSVAEARAATPRGGPLGSNPADAKHDYHNIQAVWDSTRGQGGVVGVFDSGLAFGGSPAQYDLDAGYLGVVNGQKRGIIARGFVGRYAVSCPLAERTAGLCWPYDDNGHGTAMTGYVGANDNDRGTVGVMPHGLTVSMKVTANAQWLETSCRGTANSSRTFCIHDADVSFALDYAAANAVKVVSMSWGEDLGSAVHDYLRTAHL